MHDRPPFAAAVVSVNVRVWLPLPQVLEHEPQLLHEPTQFVGHVGVLQDTDDTVPLSAPYVVVQDTPPFDAAVVTANVRLLVPLVHVVEVPHVDHDPVQVPQLPHEPTQLTPHEEVEQVWDCTAPLELP